MLATYARTLLSLTSIATILSLSHFAKGNTEIVNFAASQTESPQLTLPWIQLNYRNREVPLNITPLLDPSQAKSETGVWLILDLDDHGWDSYGRFTLRASWPASHPCDIYLRTFDSRQIVSRFPHSASGSLVQTRKKYAHVYAVNTGVPAPLSNGEDMTWLRQEPVPIVLILEPLHFGVLPHTVVPVILILAVFIGASLMIMPRVVRYYDSAAASFKEEVLQNKQE